jgi:hypothetical protein
MLEEEKRLMVLALRNGEELRRMTGRTTRTVRSAVMRALETREPVTLVGVSKESTARMVEMAHEAIDECLRGDGAERVKILVKGITYSASGRDVLRAMPVSVVFEDHYVTLTRAIEAIESL